MILGIDLALNHTGFVSLDESGSMSWYTYVTSTKKDAKAKGHHLTIAKAAERHQHDLNRLLWWRAFLKEKVVSGLFTHVGIEDYAYLGKSPAHYQIGELGGLVRLVVLSEMPQAKLRLHEPSSVKMFATHDGSSTGEQVKEAVYERWPETQVWKDLAPLVQEDLAAAYVLAKMVLAEAQLRAGILSLSSLHEKEIQVFNRTTKAHPVNLLGREWLCPPAP